MDTRDHIAFAKQARAANLHLKKSDDFNAYLGDCLNIALQALDKEYGHGIAQRIGPALTPIMRATADHLADVVCPIDNRHSAHDFVAHVESRIRENMDEAVQPLKKILSTIGF